MLLYANPETVKSMSLEIWASVGTDVAYHLQCVTAE